MKEKTFEEIIDSSAKFLEKSQISLLVTNKRMKNEKRSLIFYKTIS